MECSEALKLLPGAALGELDAEPARALAAHLESCEACRSAKTPLDAAAAALRAPSSLSGSTRRREAAASAMAAAYEEEVERRLFLRKRRLLPGRVAAAVLLAAAAAGAAFLWGRPGAEPKVDLRVAEVRGRSDVFRAAEGKWCALAAGERVAAGDRVITQQDAGVRFEVSLPRSGRALGSLFVDADAAVARVDGSRLALDRGRLFLDFREAGPEPFVVSDTANNRVAVRQGRIEVGLREVRALVGGWKESQQDRGTRAAEARPDVARRLAARVESGRAELWGSHGQCLVAEAGQEGAFELGGKPETKESAPAAGPSWWDRR
jgi:hypothetical protein